MNNKFDLILRAAEVRPDPWRYGQAVFNYAYDYFPNEVNKLRGTEYDCFHNDENVTMFLIQLKDLIKKD